MDFFICRYDLLTLLEHLSNCLMNLKNSGDSTGSYLHLISNTALHKTLFHMDFFVRKFLRALVTGLDKKNQYHCLSLHFNNTLKRHKTTLCRFLLHPSVFTSIVN